VRACLSDDKVAPTLYKHFVIVCDSSRFNRTSMGVMAFAHAPNRREIHKYFMGTGGALFSGKFVQADHDKHVAKATQFLNETLKKWQAMKEKKD
jgi:hypothetical protein